MRLTLGFSILLGLTSCGQEDLNTSKVSSRSCNESKWMQCILELSQINKDSDFGKYLRKEIECKKICNR